MAEEDTVGTKPRPAGRRGLGRGLDALLPRGQQTGPLEVDIDRIERNPNQPRQRFEPAALEDLGSSIREHGLVQPLLVSSIGDGRYRLIVGERRWQAARHAGLRRVPVVVKDATERQTLELALAENLQRADLNPLEEAAAYQRLIDDFGLTQQQVAQRMGKSRVAVANTLRLLALPETLKRALIEGRITEGHARAMLGLPSRDAQLALLERVERGGLTVRQTEELVRRLLEGASHRPVRQTPNPDAQAFEESLQRALGTKVSLRPGRRGGKIVIEYYSEDELESLYQRLSQV